MDSNLKPYEEYKETEYDWLGSVPSHWKEQTVRSITKLSSVRNGNRDDLELLSVYREYGVIRKSSRDDNHNVESLDLSNYKFVDVGYLVLNKMKMWQGSLGISKYKGIVSPAYIVCKLIGDLNHDYIHYLMRSAKFKTIYNRISYGVRVGQWDMRYDDFKSISLYLPPIEEQNQIVKYLNSKLTKINKFIQVKKKLITVLKEQKQAVINESVTQGIDSENKMKSSGIKWLGEIPQHWECKRVKTLLKNNTNTVSEKLPNEIYLGMENVESWTGRIINLDESMTFESQVKQFNQNSILFGKLRPYLAKVAAPKREGVCSTEFLVLELIDKEQNSIDYLNCLLRSKAIIEVITSSTYGAKMPRADWGFIGNLKVPIPPSFQEQQRILRYIAKNTSQQDKRIEVYEREIDLIIEYRTRLISDVVTGKVDVRTIKVDDFEVEELKEDIDEDAMGLEEVLESEECEV